MDGTRDFSNWMVVGRSEETGLGRLFADFTSLFPEMQKGVLPSIRFAQNPLGTDCRHIPREASDVELARAIEGLDGILLFENPEPERLIRVAHEKRVATVFVPMWEWFNPAFPDWNLVSRFAAPNAMCVRVLSKLGIVRPVEKIHWPLSMNGLPTRDISGPARWFVHNSGIVEKDDRKALYETVMAFERVRHPDVRLVVRAQNDISVPTTDPRIQVQAGHLPSKAALYETGDVMIQPSKAEGLGFAVLEAMGCGFPVITTDYPPMNEYVTDRRLLASTRWGSRKPVQANYIHHAHLKVPRIGALARCIEWCATHDVGHAAKRNREWVAENFGRDRMRREWERLLAAARTEAAG